MNFLLPLRGNVGDDRTFLEKEKDSIWEVDSLILLEVDPQVTSAEWGSDHMMPALYHR